MAVTATAALVGVATVDPPRPPLSGAGWNNPYGDPEWVGDVDWYRRYQLRAVGSAGEISTTVNWELYDGTVPFKTNADLATATAGAVASPYGAIINNSNTWTVWVSTGVAAAGQAKYRDTGQTPLVTLRANGPAVQVLLGPARKIGDPAVTWTIAAFAPGAGKLPSATTTQVVQNVAPYAQPTSVTVSGTATISTPGGTTNLTAVVAPGTAPQQVTWSTNSETLATVVSTGPLTAKVTALKNGSPIVYASAPGKPIVRSTGTTITITGQAS